MTHKITFKAMPPLDAPDATLPNLSMQTTPTVSIMQSSVTLPTNGSSLFFETIKGCPSVTEIKGELQ